MYLWNLFFTITLLLLSPNITPQAEIQYSGQSTHHADKKNPPYKSLPVTSTKYSSDTHKDVKKLKGFDKFMNAIFGYTDSPRDPKYSMPWNTHPEFIKKLNPTQASKIKVQYEQGLIGSVLDKAVTKAFNLPTTPRDPKWAKPWQTHRDMMQKNKTDKKKLDIHRESRFSIINSFIEFIFGKDPNSGRDPKWAKPWTKHRNMQKTGEQHRKIHKGKETNSNSRGGLVNSIITLVFEEPTGPRDKKWARPWQTHKDYLKKKQTAQNYKVRADSGPIGRLINKIVYTVFQETPPGRDPKWANPWQTHSEHRSTSKCPETKKKKPAESYFKFKFIDKFIQYTFGEIDEYRDPKWALPWQTHSRFSIEFRVEPKKKDKQSNITKNQSQSEKYTEENNEKDAKDMLLRVKEREESIHTRKHSNEEKKLREKSNSFGGNERKANKLESQEQYDETKEENGEEEYENDEESYNSEEEEDNEEFDSYDEQDETDEDDNNEVQSRVKEKTMEDFHKWKSIYHQDEMQKLQTFRSRDHVDSILGMDENSLQASARTNNIAESTLRELKKIYESAIKPLETTFKYQDISNRQLTDAEIFGTPLILLLGPYSTGKSTFINYILGTEFTERALKTGTPPSHGVFRIIKYGEQDRFVDGTDLSGHWIFSFLQKFGQNFVDQLQGRELNAPLLKKVTFVEAPGILEMRRPGERLYPFNDVVQWFIDRADLILIMFDYTKLDAGYELEAILDQLKGRESQTRILINKADQVPPEELIKVQGSLFWNLSPLLGISSPPLVYAGSFTSYNYRSSSPEKLFLAQEEALLHDIAKAINSRVDNRISIARRHAVRVRNHAQMVDTYLNTFYKNKGFLTSRHKLADEIIENPHAFNIYEGIILQTNISRYDLPGPEAYKDFFRIHSLYNFRTLRETCTYLTGCPLDKLDTAISRQLPELMTRYRKLVDTAPYGNNLPEAKIHEGGIYRSAVPAPHHHKMN